MQIHGAGVFTRLKAAAADADPAEIPKEERRPDQLWSGDEALAKALVGKKLGPHSSCSKFPIPSGAVYLAQMMVHDIMRSLPTGIRGEPFSNAVARPFMLDSMYGAGPQSDAHLYEEEYQAKVRAKFREANLLIDAKDNDLLTKPDLYRLMHGNKQVLQTVKKELPTYNDDIANACVVGINKNGIVGQVECIIGDMRNDSHAIIGQMTAVWQRYHNHLFELSVHWIDRGEFPKPDSSRARQRRFLLTQNAVRRTWLRVLQNDVLPWLVGSDAADPSNRRQPAGAIPELAILALRTLHALPQQVYKLNSESEPTRTLESILEIGSHSGTPTNMNNGWAIDWNLFFDPHPTAVECTGPCKCALNRTAYKVSHALDLKIAIDPDKPTKDWAPAFAIDLMRSRQMLDGRGGPQIDGSYNAILPEGLNTPDGQEAKVREALTDKNLNQAHIDEIATDPPLLLILLIEAADPAGGNGARLGPLGASFLQPWLSKAIHDTKQALEQSEFAAHEAPKHARFLDIVAATQTS